MLSQARGTAPQGRARPTQRRGALKHRIPRGLPALLGLAAVAGPGRGAMGGGGTTGPGRGAVGGGGTTGPGCGARGRWRGLAGLRDDAPSEARGADGSRAGRRPRAHKAARPTQRPGLPGTPRSADGSRAGRRPPAHQAARPTQRPVPPAPGTPAVPQRMFHVKHLPNHRPRYPVWPGKWHT